MGGPTTKGLSASRSMGGAGGAGGGERVPALICSYSAVVSPSGSTPSSSARARRQASYCASAAPRCPLHASSRITCRCVASRHGSSASRRRAKRNPCSYSPHRLWCATSSPNTQATRWRQRSRSPTSQTSNSAHPSRYSPARNSPRYSSAAAASAAASPWASSSSKATMSNQYGAARVNWTV